MIETYDNLKNIPIDVIVDDYKKLYNHFHKHDLQNKKHSILARLSLWYKIDKMTPKEKKEIINKIQSTFLADAKRIANSFSSSSTAGVPKRYIQYRMIRLVGKIKTAQVDSKLFKVYLKELRKLKKENKLAWLEIQ